MSISPESPERHALRTAFITALNAANCIGCGRCYKVCPRKVFELVERSEDDENYDETKTTAW